MKTIREWLKERLSEEDYKKAEKYNDEEWVMEVDNFEDALNGAFVWKDTSEGSDYWSKIYFNNVSL